MIRKVRTVKWVGCVSGYVLRDSGVVRNERTANGDARGRAGEFPAIRARARSYLCSVGQRHRVLHIMASQLLRDLTRFLAPAPPVIDSDYDGLEYTWKFFVLRPARE